MNKNTRVVWMGRISLATAALAILTLPDILISGGMARLGRGEAATQHRSSRSGRKAPVAQTADAIMTCTSAPYSVSSSAEAEIVPGTDDIGNHGNDVTTEITLPFAYKLYDQTFTTAKVSSNGVLQFVSNNTDGNNTCLPSSGFDYAIFAHWDDLCTTGDCTDTGVPAGEGVEYGIFTATFGEPGDRAFVIEWRAVYADQIVAPGLQAEAAPLLPGNFANFEIRLFENQKKFEVIYGTVTEEGCSATVGVQKDTGSCFTEYSCGTSCGMAVASTQQAKSTTALADGVVALTSGLRVTFEEPPDCSLACQGNIQTSAAEGQCGAAVQFTPPTPSGFCGEVICADAEGNTLNPGDFFFIGTTVVSCTSADAACSFSITVTEDVPPEIACSRDVNAPNDPGQCGATIEFEVTAIDNCAIAAVICDPPPGFFGIGTTPVTCTAFDTSNNTASCSFTVTVNDTQAPSITCPSTVSANTLGAPCATVNFAPVVSDNCPGTSVVCNPPSGSCFPVGNSTVMCTATDAVGLTASCSFTVSVFDVCLQDDSNSGIVFQGNSITGAYRFCCGGTVFTGTARVTKKGKMISFDQSAPDRRLLARDDETIFKGSAALQFPPGVLKCTITDRNTRNNTCLCQ
jgi:hypothetical protein